MPNAPINILIKLSADVKQAEAQIAAFKSTLESLKDSNIKIGFDGDALLKQLQLASKGHTEATQAVTKHVQAQNLLNDIYNKNSSTVQNKYLTSLSGLKQAYTRMNEEANKTFVTTKNGVVALNSHEAALTRVQIKGDMLVKTFTNMSNSMVQVGRQQAMVGRQMTSMITLPMLGAAAAATKLGLEFDKTNLTLKMGLIARGKEVANLTQAIEILNTQGSALSESFGRFSRIDITGIQAQFSHITGSLSQIKALTESTIKFGAVEGLTDLTSSTKLVGLLFTQFNGDMQKVNQTLAEFDSVASHTNIPIDALVENLPKAMGMFKQFNVDLGQGSLMLAAFTQSGQDAGQASQSLARMFAVMPGLVAGFNSSMKETGQKELRSFIDGWNSLNPDKPIAFFDAITHKALPGAVAMGNLAKAIAAMNPDDRANFVLKSAGKFQDQKVLQAFTDYGNVLNGNTEEAKQLNDALKALADGTYVDVFSQKVAAFLGDPSTKFAGQVQKLKNEATELGRSLVPIATQIIGFISKIADAFNNMAPGQKKFLAFIALGAAALGPFNAAMGTANELLGTLLKYGIAKPLSIIFKPIGEGGTFGDKTLIGPGPGGAGGAAGALENALKSNEEKLGDQIATGVILDTSLQDLSKEVAANTAALEYGPAMGAYPGEAAGSRAELNRLQNDLTKKYTPEETQAALSAISGARYIPKPELLARNMQGAGNPQFDKTLYEKTMRSLFGADGDIEQNIVRVMNEDHNALAEELSAAYLKGPRDAVEETKIRLATLTAGNQTFRSDLASFYDVLDPVHAAKPEKIRAYKAETEKYINEISDATDGILIAGVNKNKEASKALVDNYIRNEIVPEIKRFQEGSLGERMSMMDSRVIDNKIRGLEDVVRGSGGPKNWRDKFVSPLNQITGPDMNQVFAEERGGRTVPRSVVPFATQEHRKLFQVAQRAQPENILAIEEETAKIESEANTKAKNFAATQAKVRNKLLAAYDLQLEAIDATTKGALKNQMSAEGVSSPEQLAMKRAHRELSLSQKNVVPLNDILKGKLGGQTYGPREYVEQAIADSVRVQSSASIAEANFRGRTSTAFKANILDMLKIKVKNVNQDFDEAIIQAGHGYLGAMGFTPRPNLGLLTHTGGLNQAVRRISEGGAVSRSAALPEAFWNLVSLKMWGGFSDQELGTFMGKVQSLKGMSDKQKQQVLKALDQMSVHLTNTYSDLAARGGMTYQQLGLVRGPEQEIGPYTSQGLLSGAPNAVRDETVAARAKRATEVLAESRSKETAANQALLKLREAKALADKELIDATNFAASHNKMFPVVEEEKAVQEAKDAVKKQQAAVERAKASVAKAVEAQQAQVALIKEGLGRRYTGSPELREAQDKLKRLEDEDYTKRKGPRINKESQALEQRQAELSDARKNLEQARILKDPSSRVAYAKRNAEQIERQIVEQEDIADASTMAQQESSKVLAASEKEVKEMSFANRKGPRVTNLTGLKRASLLGDPAAFRYAQTKFSTELLDAMEETTVLQLQNAEDIAPILEKHLGVPVGVHDELTKLAQRFSGRLQGNMLLAEQVFGQDLRVAVEQRAQLEELSGRGGTIYMDPAKLQGEAEARQESGVASIGGTSGGGKRHRGTSETEAAALALDDPTRIQKIIDETMQGYEKEQADLEQKLVELRASADRKGVRRINQRLRELDTAKAEFMNSQLVQGATQLTEDQWTRQYASNTGLLKGITQKRIKEIENRLVTMQNLENDLTRMAAGENFTQVQSRLERDFENLGGMSNQEAFSRAILHSNDVAAGRGYQQHTNEDVIGMGPTARQRLTGAGMTVEQMEGDAQVVNQAGREAMKEAAKGMEAEASSAEGQGLFRRAFNRVFHGKALSIVASTGIGFGATAEEAPKVGLLGGALSKIMPTMGPAIAGILPEIALAAAAVAALAAAFLVIWANWDKVSKGISDGISNLGKAFSNIYHAIVDPFINAIQSLGFFNNSNKETADQIKVFWKGVGEIINVIANIIAIAINTIADIVGPVFQVIADVIKDVIRIIMILVDVLNGNLGDAWEQVKLLAKDAWNTILDVVITVAKGIAMAFTKSADVVFDAIRGIAQAAADAASGLSGIPGIGDFFGGASDAAQVVADKIEAARNKVDNLPNDIQNWGDAIKFDVSGKGEKAGKKIVEDGQRTLNNNPLQGPDINPATADNNQKVQDFLSSLQAQLKKQQSGWKDAAMKGFEDYVKAAKKAATASNKAAVDAIDDQIKEIDKLEKAMQDQNTLEEYLANLKKIRQERMFNDLEYSFNRQKALYEGNTDSAAMLDLQHMEDSSKSQEDERDLTKKHDQDILKQNLDTWKQALQDQKEALQEQQQEQQQAFDDQLSLQRDNLEKQINQIIEFAPKTAAEAGNMQQQILDTLAGYTDQYTVQAVAAGTAFQEGWGKAIADAQTDIADKAFWVGTVAKNEFATAAGVDPASLAPVAAPNAGGASGAFSGEWGSGSGADQQGGVIQQPTSGKPIQHHTGGQIGAMQTGPMNVPATLQSGEYVIQRKAVKAIGLDTLNALNQAHIAKPKYHDGGAVNDLSSGIVDAWSNIMEVAVFQMMGGQGSFGGITKDMIMGNIKAQAPQVSVGPSYNGPTDFGPGSPQDKAMKALGDWGWDSSQFGALNNLMMGESGWRPDAANPTSTARGLFQFLDTTWRSYITNQGGPPYWSTDVDWQIRGGFDYIKSRYGSPSQAWDFWQRQSPHWYHKGGPVFNVPSLDTGGKILSDGIAMVHKNERVLSADQASNMGGDVKIELNFNAGYFGTDRELQKLVDKIESDIVPKIQRKFGDQNRYITRKGQ